MHWVCQRAYLKMKVVILRGVPGSGKSHYCKQYPDAVVCSADHYMLENGVYKFDPSKLAWAHKSCFTKFMDSVDEKESLIILDNTNIKKAWFRDYLDYAVKGGYDIEIIRVICDPIIAHARNQHGVSLDKIKSWTRSLEDQPLMENEKCLASQ